MSFNKSPIAIVYPLKMSSSELRLTRLESLKRRKEECLRENKLLELKNTVSNTNLAEIQISDKRKENVLHSIEENELWGSRNPSSLSQHSFDHSESSWRKYEKEISKATYKSPGNKVNKPKSKRRHFDHEEDVTYINYRNYKFNKKLDRTYGRFGDVE